MVNRFSLIATIASVLLALSSIRCSKRVPNQDWSILFQSIPERVRVEDANINIIFYLLRQTHLPLFTENGLGQFTSAVLNRWERTADNKSFLFCPDTALTFDENTSFNSTHIASSLKLVEEVLDTKLDIRLEKRCLRVNSTKSLPSLLKLLSDYRYAPSIRCAKEWECGLGAFAVRAIKADRVILVRKVLDTSGTKFNSVTLGQASAIGTGTEISDVNRSIEQLPATVSLGKYSKFEVNLLQTIVLILNSPDFKIRRTLFNCLDSVALSSAFNPLVEKSPMITISSILPKEIYPDPPPKPGAPCAASHQKAKLNFVNWRENNFQTLPIFLNDVSRASGIKVEANAISPSKFVEALTSRSSNFKTFDLIPMAIGAESNDFTSFFRPFMDRKKKYLSYDLPGADQIYGELVNSVDREDSLRLARRLAELIARNFAAVPMYQIKRSFYYPENVRNIDTGKNFLEYPEVSKLEID